MSWGVYVLGGKCPGVSVRGVSDQGVCVLGGKCPGVKCPGGKCPGGTYLGGFCPVTPIYHLHTWIVLPLRANQFDFPHDC